MKIINLFCLSYDMVYETPNKIVKKTLKLIKLIQRMYPSCYGKWIMKMTCSAMS